MTIQHLYNHSKWNDTKLGAAVGWGASTISRVRRGQRDAGLALALRVEQETGGQVTAEEIRMCDATREQLAEFRKGQRRGRRQRSA